MGITARGAPPRTLEGDDDAGPLDGWAGVEAQVGLSFNGAAPPTSEGPGAGAASPGVRLEEDEEDAAEFLAFLGTMFPEPSGPPSPDMATMEVEALSARAGQLLRLAGAVARKLEHLDRREEADIELVRQFYAFRRTRDEQRLAWVEGELRQAAMLLRPHFEGKQKSWKTPWGVLSFRAKAGGERIEDKASFAAWVKAHLPGFVQRVDIVEERVDLKGALPEAMKAMRGELPPGVTHEHASETFSYKVAT